MIYIKSFKNYDEFKNIFAVVEHGNGVKSRKNKILLAWLKDRKFLKAWLTLREEVGNFDREIMNNLSYLNAHNVDEMKKSLKWLLEKGVYLYDLDAPDLYYNDFGCIGSSAADTEFFNDCRFCAQIDRRGNDDMITSITSQMCSEEFYKAADPTAWGYKEEYGLMTDVEVLRENGVEASCINMSCGYYEPHTDREFTSKQDLEKCYAFVCHLIEDCTAMFPFEDTLEYAIKSRYGYVFEEDELYDMISEIISTEPYITFDEFYLNYGCSFDKINKERQRDMFFECKSFYNFGN